MANPTLRRTAVLLIRDNRSRTVCSVLLRHEGLRVVEASTPDDLLDLASEHPVDLVIADLDRQEQSAFQRKLLAQQPSVSCVFVDGDLMPEAIAKEVRMRIRRDDDPLR